MILNTTEFEYLLTSYNNHEGIKRKGDNKIPVGKCKSIKNFEAKREFLNLLDTKRFIISKIISKNYSKLDKEMQFKLNRLRTKPLSDKACNYFLTYFLKANLISDKYKKMLACTLEE